MKFIFNVAGNNAIIDTVITTQPLNLKPENDMQIIDINAAAPADRLGQLLAQISQLTKQADAIKDEFKNEATSGGDKVFEGNLFKATVVEANRKAVDNLSVLAATVVRWSGVDPTTEDGAKRVQDLLALKPEQSDVDRFTTVAASFSVRCTAR